MFPEATTSRLTPCEVIQGRAQTFETGSQSFRIAANTNAEMLGHFKERAGYYRGFVLFAQQFEKCFRITAHEPRKKHRASRWAEAFEIAA